LPPAALWTRTRTERLSGCSSRSLSMWWMAATVSGPRATRVSDPAGTSRSTAGRPGWGRRRASSQPTLVPARRRSEKPRTVAEVASSHARRRRRPAAAFRRSARPAPSARRWRALVAAPPRPVRPAAKRRRAPAAAALAAWRTRPRAPSRAGHTRLRARAWSPSPPAGKTAHQRLAPLPGASLHARRWSCRFRPRPRSARRRIARPQAQGMCPPERALARARISPPRARVLAIQPLRARSGGSGISTLSRLRTRRQPPGLWSWHAPPASSCPACAPGLSSQSRETPDVTAAVSAVASPA
jgi:hypothetical protein